MLYFAYGSNMNLDQMRKRCGGEFGVLGRAELKGYELGFDPRGYANIRPRTDSHVWGVLFEISEQCRNALDKYEGYPKVYSRQDISVEHSGQPISAFVYVEDASEFGGAPKGGYLSGILMGAKENNLPADWVQHLEALK